MGTVWTAAPAVMASANIETLSGVTKISGAHAKKDS